MPEVGIELYRVIEVRGPDAADFLQGQLTHDVTRHAAENRLFAAWCNAKGRVIVTMTLASIDDGIAMVVAGNMAKHVLDLMQMYRFRAKVELDPSDADPANFVDARHLSMAGLIRDGIPLIDAGNTEEFTPHMLNLDKLAAISFDKGCYTGQEIVARTEHRGRSKRRMMRYAADADGIDSLATVEEDGRAACGIAQCRRHHDLAARPAIFRPGPRSRIRNYPYSIVI
jgi:folate-binding protein YgfZ